MLHSVGIARDLAVGARHVDGRAGAPDSVSLVLELCVLLGLAFGIAIFKDIRPGFDRADAVRRRSGPGGGGAHAVRGAAHNRIFYDEQIYQSIGQNLTDLRLAQICNDGSVEYGRLQCLSGEYNKQPYGYPHLLSLAYRLFGVGTAVAFAVNAAAMVATVWAVYVLVWLLVRDRDAALFAGLVLALTPHQIIWSATADASADGVARGGRSVGVRSALPTSGGRHAWGCRRLRCLRDPFRPESLLVLPSRACSRGRAFATRSASRTWWSGSWFLGWSPPLRTSRVQDLEWGASARGSPSPTCRN